MTIYIHEFSTGIQAEETTDGGWVSRGFTGEYMNKTIDSIPRVVQEGISNRDFAVAEGASSEEPAFIGREMSGYSEEWSVIAVVTRGRDDRGRSASVYRYFLSEGLGKLPAIWNWLQSEKANGRKIFFQPFDPYFAANAIAEPHQDLNENIPYPKKLPDDLKDLLDRSIPILIPHDSSYPPTILNKVAEEIKAEDRLIAWAYNVEALEEPRGFQVIQPANGRAEDLLNKAIASKPNSPAPVSGEKAIISAIKGLVMRDRVKPEQVETIENALGNPQIDDAYWESIFKGRGADKALKQGIYSADMVRLLTLKAMLLPETLPEFLVWISKEGKQQESKEVSNIFQSEMKKSLNQFSESETNLISRVCQGVISIIPELIGKPQLLDSVVWLLSSDKGLWGYFYSRQIKNAIDNDLRSMRYYGRGKQGVDFKLAEDKQWPTIFSEIEVFWRSRSRMQPQYQPLAELFSRLENYQLSALFHHISSGVVPKEVFYKLISRGFSTQVYGIRVKREIGSLESLYLKTVEIGGQIVPVYLVAILMVFTIPVSFFGGKFISKSEAKEPSKPEINQTQKSIENLTNFFIELGGEKQQIKKSLNSILENANQGQTLNLAELGTEKKDEAVKAYQENFVKDSKNIGMIEHQEKTYKALKCDLAYELGFTSKNFPQNICKNVFPETKESVRKITNDFIIHRSKSKDEIENIIKEIFNQVNEKGKLTLSQITQNNKEGNKIIKTYQEKVVKLENSDGKIINGEDSFKVLKCHVAKKLDISLSDPDKCELVERYIE